MQQQNVTINNPSGLHARPGKDFVQLAKTFQAEVKVVKNGAEYNGKSLLKLMQAGITKGDSVTVICDGADENEALSAMVNYLNNLDD